jgi:hypothetical protein
MELARRGTELLFRVAPAIPGHEAALADVITYAEMLARCHIRWASRRWICSSGSQAGVQRVEFGAGQAVLEEEAGHRQ